MTVNWWAVDNHPTISLVVVQTPSKCSFASSFIFIIFQVFCKCEIKWNWNEKLWWADQIWHSTRGYPDSKRMVVRWCFCLSILQWSAKMSLYGRGVKLIFIKGHDAPHSWVQQSCMWSCQYCVASLNIFSSRRAKLLFELFESDRLKWCEGLDLAPRAVCLTHKKYLIQWNSR